MILNTLRTNLWYILLHQVRMGSKWYFGEQITGGNPRVMSVYVLISSDLMESSILLYPTPIVLPTRVIIPGYTRLSVNMVEFRNLYLHRPYKWYMYTQRPMLILSHPPYPSIYPRYIPSPSPGWILESMTMTAIQPLPLKQRLHPQGSCFHPACRSARNSGQSKSFLLKLDAANRHRNTHGPLGKSEFHISSSLSC